MILTFAPDNGHYLREQSQEEHLWIMKPYIRIYQLATDNHDYSQDGVDCRVFTHS